MKPHKGKIYHWKKIPFDFEKTKAFYNEEPGLGYVIAGYKSDHIGFDNYWRTSWIVEQDGNEVETRNSRYTLVGDEVV